MVARLAKGSQIRSNRSAITSWLTLAQASDIGAADGNRHVRPDPHAPQSFVSFRIIFS